MCYKPKNWALPEIFKLNKILRKTWIFKFGNFWEFLFTKFNSYQQTNFLFVGEYHCTCHVSVWLMIAFITWNSNLLHLLEGLYSSNPCGVEFLVFWVFVGIEVTTFGQSCTLPKWASLTSSWSSLNIFLYLMWYHDVSASKVSPGALPRSCQSLAMLADFHVYWRLDLHVHSLSLFPFSGLVCSLLPRRLRIYLRLEVLYLRCIARRASQVTIWKGSAATWSCGTLTRWCLTYPNAATDDNAELNRRYQKMSSWRSLAFGPSEVKIVFIIARKEIM